MDKFKPWEEDPNQRKAGPLRYVERDKRLLLLQTWVWCEYSDEYMETEKPKQTGERAWVDVPLEEE